MDPNPFPLDEPSSSTRAHFESTPWCAKLFNDPTLQPFNNKNFEPTETFNSFIGKTLATKDTIIASQAFQRPSQLGSSHFTEVFACISLGSGVNGHYDTCHGGFVSVLLDETCGNAAEFERPSDKSSMTAYLNVNYKKPVHTPGTILSRAVVERKEGKKLFVKGYIEDGNGTVLATADSLFILTDPVRPMERL
ncbi:HotDog domain-containing protein [Tricladium varicosporioides]|nr:HotDog domain-containing protein [Hymenoscyphus varicosporioides]